MQDGHQAFGPFVLDVTARVLHPRGVDAEQAYFAEGVEDLITS